MRIAVISEVSARARNDDLLAALAGRGHEVVNAGMRSGGDGPELTYINTAFMSAALLAAGRADLVVGGCGTGQGYLNAVMQYPGVVCGHLLTPLDAFLFRRINAGNCIALMLNQGYGWGSDLVLRQVFDAFFGAEAGAGYPDHRAESQAQSRRLLADLSRATHLPFERIVPALDRAVTGPAFAFPGFLELLDPPTIAFRELGRALREASEAG